MSGWSGTAPAPASTPSFMTNVYGWDENAIESAGEAGNGMVWVVTASTWDDDVPGMALVREVSMMSDEGGEVDRPVHYMRGVCTAFFMRDGMAAAADMDGGVTGPQRQDGAGADAGPRAGRPGRRLPAVDLDGRGPPRHDRDRPLSQQLQLQPVADVGDLLDPHPASARLAGLVGPSEPDPGASVPEPVDARTASGIRRCSGGLLPCCPTRDPAQTNATSASCA